MSFDFVQQGASAAILHAGRPIVEFRARQNYFGGPWWALHQCMEPGGEPEVAVLAVFAFFGYRHAVSDVDYEVVDRRDDGLTLGIVPADTLTGRRALQRVSERCTLRVTLQENRYVWTQTLTVRAQEDIDIARLTKKTPLRVYRYPRPDGQPGLYMQFADPMPVSSSGPAVPMTFDWLLQFEPYVGPESFRAHWRRRYTDIVFQDPDGTFARSELNKAKWHWLTEDNQCARACHPQGLLYLLKEDGSALEYTCNAPSHFHHVCEWGMDFHFWMDLEPFLDGAILREGTQIECGTTVRLVDPDVTAPVLAAARPIELTDRERAGADQPAYEEPENTFTVSVLDRLDAQFWIPTSEGCRWERRTGYRPGCGSLVIRNEQAHTAAWELRQLGPQQWCNPFLANRRYRLSAWIRLEEFERGWCADGPQVGVEIVQSEGPAPLSRHTRIDLGWSPPVFAPGTPRVARTDWTRVEIVTAPFPSHVLHAHIRLRLQGRGTAWFSGVRWELQDTE